MFDGILLVLFVNLFAVLPLYSAFQLAEHLSPLQGKNFCESLISKPWLMCFAVSLAASFLALRISQAANSGQFTQKLIVANFFGLILVWVFPNFLNLQSEVQAALANSWTVGTSALLLIFSFQIPLKAIIKALHSKNT